MALRVGRNLPVFAAGVVSATLALAMQASSAYAWSGGVIRHCTSDYFAFCKQHGPFSSGLRACMEAHRHQISQPCVQALINSGEVPKKYLADQQPPQKR